MTFLFDVHVHHHFLNTSKEKETIALLEDNRFPPFFSFYTVYRQEVQSNKHPRKLDFINLHKKALLSSPMKSLRNTLCFPVLPSFFSFAGFTVTCILHTPCTEAKGLGLKFKDTRWNEFVLCDSCLSLQKVPKHIAQSPSNPIKPSHTHAHSYLSFELQAILKKPIYSPTSSSPSSSSSPFLQG